MAVSLGLLPQCSVAAVIGGVGTVDHGVAIGAAVGVERLLPRVHHAAVSRVMGLYAEKRHCRRQQPPVDRSMGGVAGCTVFGDIAMFIDERAALFHVAAGTEIPQRAPFQQFWLGGPVG